MAKAEPAAQSLIVRLGIPTLVLGLGVAMLGFRDFWVGIAVMTIYLPLFWWMWWQQFRSDKLYKRLIGIIASVIAYAIVLKILIVPAPLSFLVITDTPTYASDADINGIKWKPHFTEMDVTINNPSDHDYLNLELYVRIDALIIGGGVSSGFNQCSVGPDLSYIGPVKLTGVELSMRLFDGSRPISASIYRMRCDRLAARSKIDAVFAVISNVPLDRTKVQPRWTVIQVDYTANLRPLHCFIKQCFIGDCEEDVKTTSDPPCQLGPA